MGGEAPPCLDPSQTPLAFPRPPGRGGPGVSYPGTSAPALGRLQSGRCPHPETGLRTPRPGAGPSGFLRVSDAGTVPGLTSPAWQGQGCAAAAARGSPPPLPVTPLARRPANLLPARRPQALRPPRAQGTWCSSACRGPQGSPGSGRHPGGVPSLSVLGSLLPAGLPVQGPRGGVQWHLGKDARGLTPGRCLGARPSQGGRPRAGRAGTLSQQPWSPVVCSHPAGSCGVLSVTPLTAGRARGRARGPPPASPGPLSAGVPARLPLASSAVVPVRGRCCRTSVTLAASCGCGTSRWGAGAPTLDSKQPHGAHGSRGRRRPQQEGAQGGAVAAQSGRGSAVRVWARLPAEGPH